MKKILPVLLILVIHSAISMAQSVTDPLRQINMELRAMFSPLSKPSPARLFLYDMSAHNSDSIFYTSYSTDTSDLDNWLLINREMFYSAYDTLPLETADSIYARGNQFSNDTIPIGIMDYDYYEFKTNALNTNIYFDFDTVNDILSDKPGRPDFPSDIKKLFAAAALVSEAQTVNVTYRVDPAFIFKDTYNAATYTPGTNVLKMDFGDGTGWHIFAGNTVQHQSVAYSSAGYKIIKAAIYDKTGTMIKLSTSRIYSSGVTLPTADTYLDLPGMTVGVFGGCTDNNKYNKVVIVCEGWDMMDFMASKNRNAAMIYNERIKDPQLSQLRNFGYTFLVIDWKNSRIDIKANAMYLVNFIDRLKCNLMDSDNDHQFVVIGESMGGLVARYALCYMESQFYIATCKQSQMHHTRLLMTFDTPHRGANLPMAYQWLYKDALRVLNGVVPIGVHQLSYAGNLFLGSRSAQQMLLYHVDTYVPGFVYTPYAPHPQRPLFLADLASIGNYPQYCKKIALSDGSLSGKKQTNDHSGTDRLANDFFVNLDASMHVNILHTRIKLFGAKLQLNSNPFGPGQVYKIEAGTWALRLKLKWFGIKVEVGLNSLISNTQGAFVKDYCTNAGGVSGPDLKQDIGSSIASAIDKVNKIFFHHHSYTNLGGGNYTITASSRNNWFGSGATVGSQGMHFGFVPTYSALDYSVGGILNYNIETEAIAVKNTKTAWDVIMGIPNSLTGASSPMTENIYKNQREHALPTNYNLGIGSGAPEYYRSCISPGPNIEALVLAREIGDEIMWLDNMLLNRRAMYESEYDLHVNRPNPYYEYISSFTSQAIPGIYSKSAPFFIVPITGLAIFKYDNANSSNIPFAFTYDPPMSGTYQLVDVPLANCCTDFRALVPFNTEEEEEIVENSMSIFPNPSDGSTFMVRFLLKEKGEARIRLYNMAGQQIMEQTLPAVDTKREAYLPLDVSGLSLKKGMYLVILSNAYESFSRKLIIQ